MATGLYRQIAVILATAITLLVNFLSNALPINNVTAAELSDSFNIFFVPAGYVFSIWGIIYIGLIAFSSFQATRTNRENTFFDKIFPLYLISCAANSIWLLAWHYKQVALSVVVMLVLLGSLIFLQKNIYRVKDATKRFYWFVTVPFNIYLGWISVATIVNITVLLFSLNWDGFGIAPQMWSGIMIIVAGLLGLIVSLYRKDIFFPLVIIWAINGIQAKFPTISEITSAVQVSFIILILAILWVIFGEFRRYKLINL